jgi:hypothetical protein
MVCPVPERVLKPPLNPVLNVVPYAVVALLAVFGVPAQAQEPAAATPAHISVVDGAVSLERDGQPDPAPASMPLMAGDRLRTDSGRVEVMFGDGATLQLDVNSTVDFQSDNLIRLLQGRIRITIPGPRQAIAYRIDAPAGWIEILEAGDYRVSVTRGGREPEIELAVLRGAADLLNEDGRTSLLAGERALARTGLAPSTAYAYNSAAFDEFDRWSDSRRAIRAGISAQYLPETVRPYTSTFDRYGDWRYDTSYGYVWYPTVSVGWRPYFYGRWASFPSYGWTWIGSDAWAWPTHHYGRWGFSGSAWFWIPGRTWGPAWVSWAYAPGYVSWCPLGWDNRAVFHLGRGVYYGGRYDAWTAWTVVPHQRFGVGYVNTTYVGRARLDVHTRDAFAVRTTAPELRGSAVARTTAPIRSAGSRVVSVQQGYASAGRVPAGTLTGVRPGGSTAGIRGPSRAGAQDTAAAAAFRNQRPELASRGVGYPAPARQPRDAADVGGRIASRTSQDRPTDIPGVTVYRGAVPRQADQRTSGAAPGRPDVTRPGTAPTQSGAAPGGVAVRRYEPPGYQRAPSASAPGALQQRPVPGSDRPATAAPRYESPRVMTPADPSGRAPARQAPERQMPIRQIPDRQMPDRQINDAYRAVPRQAPQAPPESRSYGGIERRSAPSSPAPSAAPQREPGGRPAVGSPQGRPSGDSPNRGGAVRRGGE